MILRIKRGLNFKDKHFLELFLKMIFKGRFKFSKFPTEKRIQFQMRKEGTSKKTCK